MSTDFTKWTLPSLHRYHPFWCALLVICFTSSSAIKCHIGSSSQNSSAEYEAHNLSAEFEFCFVRVTFSSDSCSVVDYEFGGLNLENATTPTTCTVKSVDAATGEEIDAIADINETQTKRIQCHCNDFDLCSTKQETFENHTIEQIALLPNQTTVHHCLLGFFESGSYLPNFNASEFPVPTLLPR
ncbi:hypothetical protein Y032_0562g3485, partial [Ancylostoma ceylanicum]